MVYKACIYKGCENYTYDSVPCGHNQFTIFRFPKDPRRYEQWMKRGQVPDGLPEAQMLMCSDHFDDKYIIKNSRRTMLTSSALPFPYYEANSDIECEENIGKECEDAIPKVGDTEMVFSIQGDMSDISALIRLKESVCDGDDDDGMLEYEKVENNSDAEYCVESTTMKDEADEQIGEMVDEFQVSSDYEDEIVSEIVTQSNTKASAAKSSNIYVCKKRKMDSDVDETQEPTSSKVLASKISTLSDQRSDSSGTVSKRSAKLENEDDDDKHTRLQNKKYCTLKTESAKLDPEALVDTKAVTSFIFKGEEYVQMPKEYYVHEKLELIEKLKKYESVLRSIKNNLSKIDLP